MTKTFIFQDHAPPSSSSIWPLPGAWGRQSVKWNLMPNGQGCCPTQLEGCTGTHTKGPFIRNTTVSSQKSFHAETCTVYNYPGPGNKCRAGFRRFSRLKLSEQRQSNLGEFS